MNKLLMSFLFFSIIGIASLQAMEDDSLKKHKRMWLIGGRTNLNGHAAFEHKLFLKSFFSPAKRGDRSVLMLSSSIFYHSKGAIVRPARPIYLEKLLDVTGEFNSNFEDYPNKQTLEKEKKELIGDGVHLGLEDIKIPDTNTLVGYLLQKANAQNSE